MPTAVRRYLRHSKPVLLTLPVEEWQVLVALVRASTLPATVSPALRQANQALKDRVEQVERVRLARDGA